MKTYLIRVAMLVEGWIDRLRRGERGPPTFEPYRGDATPKHLVIRGRGMARKQRLPPERGHSRWTNARRMVSLFLTGEVPGVRVEVAERGIGAVSDEEGYVTVTTPRRDGDTPGWLRLSAQIAGHFGTEVRAPVLVPAACAQWGVISDIDDTVIETGAYSLVRNLWTTFTGNSLTRHVFPDAVALLERLSRNGRNPVFYVSSSPWNLFAFLEGIFTRAGVVPGPMFLRDFGIGQQQFITGTHANHKGGAIDTILRANPELKFILVGDTGQHDAKVYGRAIQRHPGRILAVCLRQAGPSIDA